MIKDIIKMKYLKDYKIFESKSEIESICQEYGIQHYIIQDDGTVDVNGNVNLSNKGLTKHPIKFGRVSGFFDCSYNELTSLEGCPKEVGGNFDCSHNKLTSLEGCPKEVSGRFYCYSNKLKVLKYEDLMSINVGGYFYIDYNPIYEVYKIFNDFKIFKESLEWNYFSEPNLISKIRLQDACEILSGEKGKNFLIDNISHLELDIVIPNEIKGYKII